LWNARRVLVFLLLCSCSRLFAQAGSGAVSADQLRQMAAEQRWQEIVVLVEHLNARTADLDFYYGTALARLQRWNDAEAAFQSGLRLSPRDPRFPIELAGVAFKRKRYPQAARRLRQALKLAPQDVYANDFLGTIYFLEGNLDGSLEYWNRAGKPQIAEVKADPQPQLSPVLLDRAFAFSPAATLQRSEFHATEARIESLGIFPRYQFDLRAREDDKFDVVFRNQERNGFGSSKWEGLFLLLRGLPFLSLNPEYYNLRHQAMNVVTMFRWDPDKRRVFAEFSSPFEHSGKYRYEIAADLRNENWRVLNPEALRTLPLASLNLRRQALRFDFASYQSGNWQWSAGGELSHRDFRSVLAGSALPAPLLAQGYQLKQLAELKAILWRFPERRFIVEGRGSSQAARLWSDPIETSEKLEGSLGWHWLPRATGDDYEMQQQFRAGKTFGTVPFDELFMLGLERDNDVLMRAHIGTHAGRKGSAPLGRNYFVANWETDKNLYANGIVTVKLGPFIDTGKITDPVAMLGAQKWLADVGAQIKLRVFGAGVAFSYGKDLRSGNNAFYLRMLK
jgi:tetratricopeptide (TPR) repeat protein